MKKTILSLLLMFIAASAIARTQRPQERRKAVGSETPIIAATYNIRMNNPRDGVDAWPNRADMVRGLIRFHEWDIFGTQEGFKSQLDDLAQMEEYGWIGVGRDDGGEGGEHSAIFYRKARFELLDKGDFWLSETPEKPSPGWDARIFRICSWGRFRDKLSGREFYFFCAHYDHIGQQARIESSKLILGRISEIAGGAPTILVGDLNAYPDNEAITTLDGVLLDARKVTRQPPYGPLATFNSFDWNREGKDDDNRIDYLFCSPGIEVMKYGVLTDSKEKRYPSDHFPVMIELVIK